MAEIKKSEVLNVIREFLNEYGCGAYLEGKVPSDGPKLPEGSKPDLFFVQTDEEGNLNDGIVMVLEAGKHSQKAVQNTLRGIVNAWVDDEFDLLMIALPAGDGEQSVEVLENAGVYADYWLLYEREDDGELSLTVLYDEMDEEEEPMEEIIIEEIDAPKPKTTAKKTTPAKTKPAPKKTTPAKTKPAPAAKKTTAPAKPKPAPAAKKTTAPAKPKPKPAPKKAAATTTKPKPKPAPKKAAATTTKPKPKPKK